MKINGWRENETVASQLSFSSEGFLIKASRWTPIGPKRFDAGPAPPIWDWYDSKIFFRAFMSMSTGWKSSTSSNESSSLDVPGFGWKDDSFLKFP